MVQVVAHLSAPRDLMRVARGRRIEASTGYLFIFRRFNRLESRLSVIKGSTMLEKKWSRLDLHRFNPNSLGSKISKGFFIRVYEKPSFLPFVEVFRPNRVPIELEDAARSDDNLILFKWSRRRRLK